MPELFWEEKIQEDNILKIYNDKTWKILEYTKNNSLIRYYYGFKNGVSIVNNNEILFDFLYKIIYLWKIGK